MNYRKEIERAVLLARESFAGRKDHTADEITEIGKDFPVRSLKSPALFVRSALSFNMSLRDCMVVAAWTGSMSGFLDDISVTSDISHSKAVGFYERARVSTIVLHRVNYVLHDSMFKVYDILERDGRMRFAVKRMMGEAERRWDAYEGGRRHEMEKCAWYTLQDHLRIVTDSVAPYLEKVYGTVRDFMIARGMRDVEVRGRCAVALLLGKVAAHTYRAFFRDFEKECGIDFTGCFRRDDMQDMTKAFALLCDALGIDTRQDENGCWECVEVNPEDSQRFRWAWGDFIKALRDDDLMDEGARKAIDLNPQAREEYRQIIEEDEEQRLQDSIGHLGDKFTVKHK